MWRGQRSQQHSCKVKVKDGIIDRKIYTSGYFSHSICKYELTGNAALADFKKKAGIGNAFTENKANNSQLYLYYPMGIDFGVGAADADTLFVTNYGRLEITMLDPENLTYKDHFGDPGVSRFQGCLLYTSPSPRD